MRWPLVSSVPKLAHATADNTVRNSIDRLVWESYHKCVVLCQECSTSVGRHRSCHMQVSSVLQQYVVDDLLLVAIDIRHHDSHHKTVLEERLFCNLCWLPDGNSSEILVLWKKENRSVGNPSACRGNLAVHIKHLP